MAAIKEEGEEGVVAIVGGGDEELAMMATPEASLTPNNENPDSYTTENECEGGNAPKIVQRAPINQQRTLNLNDSAIMSASVGGPKQLANTPSNAEDYVYYCYSATGAAGGEEVLDETETHMRPKSLLEQHAKRKSERSSGGKICCFCCCFCCAKRLASTRLCRFLTSFQRRLKDFVDGKFFQRTILFAILINTLSMGIEHHQQPQKLTLILEYSNMFFSGVFLIEMILKLLAYGIFDYIKNAFNLFDGAIVGISCYEVIRQLTNAGGADGVSSGPSGVSVLRTFRLLRILKLVRFMPALRRQLLVMLKTVDNVATFFSLLILFIFIFSILGMNLFGCKFCELTDGERVCERKNFDSLLWAILTVFQVLTQEDWNEVLYNSMYKTSSWAALYYIALMTFGNYVLFNLLVAILVEGFSTEDEPKKALEERIIEDAIHAIQEQERQSRHSGGSRRGSRRGRSRKGSKACSQEGGGEARKSISHNREEAPLIPSQSELPNEASNTKANSDTISETPSAKMLIQLPIITHTSPTPISSPGNSPRVSRSRLADNNPRLDARLATDKAFRKHSLDSFYLSRKKNRPLPKSKTFTTSPTNQQQQQQIDEISRPTNISLTQIFIPQRLPTTNNANTKPLNPPKIMIETHEGEIKPITPETPQIDTNEKEPTTTKTVQIEEAAFIKSHPAIERNRATSKSFNEKSLLAIPKIRYKHQRSKSEKSKSHKSRTQSTDSESMRNNLSDYQLSSNATDESAEQQLPVLSTTDRTVLIQKSPPYNVDIVGTSDPTAKADSVRTRINSTSTSTRRSVKSAAKNQKKTYEQEDDDEMITNKFKKPKDFNCCGNMPRPKGCFKSREEYSLYIFSKENKFRLLCKHVAEQKWFDYTILLFISLNCITLAMERPTIPPGSLERKFLTNSNYLFTVIFAIEMSIKVLANGFFVGERAYLTSGWNIMDCFLVVISLVDVAVSLTARSSPKIFGILRVFRLLRTLRPLRMISRAPGLKLVVQTLLSSLRPIGNIVLICCTFFIIFGILGVQLFKGKLFRCIGEDVKNIRTKDECLAVPGNQWVNSQYNFDNLGLALMALFVLSSKDGWVQIMYTGIDAVGIDRQPIVNYNEWMLLYFISFLLLVGFFVLNMFVGVVIENFHKCREQQEREEKARRAAKRAKKFEEKRRKMREIPYYASYSKTRRLLHDICNSKYFDLIIAGVIGLNVVSMSLEFYMMPKFLEEVLDVFNFVFTIIFLLEAIVRIVAIGFFRYFKERWNQLDILIVIMSIAGIIFDKLDSRKTIPINPTIIRVMRVLRIARVLKLLKMAKGIRSLLDTVIQALPQVGNLGLLFFLLFFIFAILGVELFGRLNCESTNSACDGLSKHAHFHNFGMAFLTLFRIATGDNWNGIMKDTLRENQLCQDDNGVVSSSMCLASVLAPIYFVIFVLMAQFVLVNVVVAVLMKHLDESNKMMADDAEMDEEIERQLEAEARNNIYDDTMQKLENDFDSDIYNPYAKQSSLPPNFTFDLNQPKSPSQHENTSYEQATLHSNQSENTSTNEETTSDNATNKKTKSGEDMELNRLTQNDQENTDRPLSVTSSSTATSSAIKYKSILKHHHSSCSNQAKEAVQTSSRRASAGYGASSGRQSGNNNQQLLDNESNLSILNESDSVSCIMSMRQANKENRPYSIKYDAVADSDVFNSSNSNLSAGSFNANNSTSSPSSNHQHFSPRSSMKIKVIDENDTNDTDN